MADDRRRGIGLGVEHEWCTAWGLATRSERWSLGVGSVQSGGGRVGAGIAPALDSASVPARKGKRDHLGQIHWNRCPSCSAAAMHLDHTIPSQPAGTGQPRLPSTARPPPALLHKSPGQARHTAPWGGVPKTRRRTLGPGGTRMRGEGGNRRPTRHTPTTHTHGAWSTFHSSIFCRSSPVIHPSSCSCFKLPSRDHLLRRALINGHRCRVEGNTMDLPSHRPSVSFHTRPDPDP
jgi:hypothetical protein